MWECKQTCIRTTHWRSANIGLNLKFNYLNEKMATILTCQSRKHEPHTCNTHKVHRAVMSLALKELIVHVFEDLHVFHLLMRIY